MFAKKVTGRALRSRRLFVLLSGILALITIYSVIPAVIAKSLQYRLALAGFTEIVVNAGRPSWNTLHFDSIRFSRRAGNRLLTIRMEGMVIRYKPLQLLSGRFVSLQLAKAEIVSRFIENRAPADKTRANLEPIALVPGFWLPRLPAQTLYLDKVDIQLWTPSGELYRADAAVRIKNGGATLVGEIRPAERTPLTFSAYTDLSGTFALDVQTSGKSASPVLHLIMQSEVKDDHVRIDGSAQASLNAIGDFLKPWFGPTQALPLISGHAESRWQGTIPVAESTWQGVKVTSLHNIEIRAESSNGMIRNAEASIEAGVWLEGSRIRWHIRDQSRLSAGFGGRMNDPEQPKVLMTFPKGLAGLIDIAPEGLTFDFLSGFPTHLASVTQSGITFSGVDVEYGGKVRLRYNPERARWDVEPFALLTTPTCLHWASGEIQTDPIRLEIEALSGGSAGWEGRGELHARRVTPMVQGKTLPPTDVRLKFRGNSIQFDLESVVALSEGKLLLNGRARHQFSSGQGSAQFEFTPVVFGESGITPNQLPSPWPHSVGLHAGRIHIHGGSHWSRSAGDSTGGIWRFQNDLTIDAYGLVGRFKTARFKGLDAHLALSDQNGSRTLNPARISIERLDFGIPITQLRLEGAVMADAGAARQSVKLRRFTGNLFGGTIHGGPFQWHGGRLNPPLTLNVEGLSLAQIIALERQSGLQGSGRLDGVLPLDIAKTHVAIHGGELKARPPGGWIRYHPTEDVKALEKDNVGVQLVNQALSNLQYQKLKIRADSTPEGELMLRVELKGHNPDWQSDRPIHLNLSVRENLAMLLRSLSITDELTERVTRQVQDRYRKKP